MRIGTTCQFSSGDKSSTTSPWIAAWNEGTPLNTASLSANINQHDSDAYSQINLDLTQAVLADDSNPFVAAASTTGTSTPAGPVSNTTGGAETGGGSSGSGSGSGSGSSISQDNHKEKVSTFDKAHGIIMGLVSAVLFPLGAIFIRLGGNIWLHASMQLLSFLLLVSGLALGIKLAQYTDQLWGNTHTTLGLVVVAMFVIQPLLGLAHHFLFVKTLSRNVFSYLHIWYGRALMILAVVNGGLGLQLAGNSKGGTIAYSVVAGIFGVAYIGTTLWKRKGNSIRTGKNESSHSQETMER